MATAVILLATTAFSIYASNKQSQYAADAAQAESTARQNLYAREQKNRRLAIKENTATRLQERDRRLSELRVDQAAAGFSGNSGTQLAIFGAFRSRLDEQIDEATNQGLDQVASLRSQAKMESFATSNQIGNIEYSNKMNNIATGISGATQAFGSYQRERNAFGNDPFSVF